MDNYKVKNESTLPLTPTILRQKKRILRTRQSIKQNSENSIQKLNRLATNNKTTFTAHDSFDRSFDNSNPTLLTGQKKRTSFGTVTSFEQTTPYSRYSFAGTAKKQTSLYPDSEIRRQLDEKLADINKILSERKLSFDLPNNKINMSEKLRGQNIDRNLVHQYLELIYRDYDIPLLNQSSDLFSVDCQYREKYEFLKTQPIETIKSKLSPICLNNEVIPVKSNRKAMQLKKMFIQQMLTSSIKSNHFSQSEQQESKHKFGNLNNKINIINQLHSVNDEIPQNYRYCLVCERKMDNFNKQTHQKQKCFEILFSKNIRELKTILTRLLFKIKSEGEEIYRELFCDQSQQYLLKKLRKLREQTKKYFSLVENKLDLNRQDSTTTVKNRLKANYQEITQIMNEQWEKLYECIQKINWFMFMLISLQERQDQNEGHCGLS